MSVGKTSQPTNDPRTPQITSQPTMGNCGRLQDIPILKNSLSMAQLRLEVLYGDDPNTADKVVVGTKKKLQKGSYSSKKRAPESEVLMEEDGKI